MGEKNTEIIAFFHSLASLGEIKNLFVPCSFRAGNNFFIFFHPCNNSPIKKVKKVVNFVLGFDKLKLAVKQCYQIFWRSGKWRICLRGVTR